MVFDGGVFGSLGFSCSEDKRSGSHSKIYYPPS